MLPSWIAVRQRFTEPGRPSVVDLGHGHAVVDQRRCPRVVAVRTLPTQVHRERASPSGAGLPPSGVASIMCVGSPDGPTNLTLRKGTPLGATTGWLQYCIATDRSHHREPIAGLLAQPHRLRPVVLQRP